MARAVAHGPRASRTAVLHVLLRSVTIGVAHYALCVLCFVLASADLDVEQMIAFPWKELPAPHFLDSVEGLLSLPLALAPTDWVGSLPAACGWCLLVLNSAFWGVSIALTAHACSRLGKSRRGGPGSDVKQQRCGDAGRTGDG